VATEGGDLVATLPAPITNACGYATFISYLSTSSPGSWTGNNLGSWIDYYTQFQVGQLPMTGGTVNQVLSVLTAGVGAFSNTWWVYGDGVISITPTLWVETPEQAAERAAELEKYTKRRAVAHKRSEDLLVSLLNPKQLETYHADKVIDIEVRGRVYRLRPGWKVHEIEKDGKARVAYCIHPGSEHGLPECDVLIAQKLLLETDPDKFHKIANRWPVAA
jgi:hypothetical protein